MKKILVISPGVLPLPPYLGGAVETMIYRLHPYFQDSCEMHYVSVMPPAFHSHVGYEMPNANFHYISSINPLEDFSIKNDFELLESEKWPEFRDHCMKAVQSERFDLIHIHNEAHLVSNLRQQSGNARIVLHINDEFVTRMNRQELASMADSADLVLSCSNFIHNSVVTAYQQAGVAPPRCDVFYNFVDANFYSRAALDQQKLAGLSEQLKISGGPVILFVGRMIEQKGPHLALRAFRRVREKFPNAIMLFVGAPWYSRNNQSRFIDYLKEESRDLEESIRFTGYIDQLSMPYCYGLADILLVPSIWNDPSPFVAYEGQSMSLPVVGSDRGGIPEIIEHGVTGFSIDVFNISLFAKKIEELCTDASLIKEFGRRGRERVLSNFEIHSAARNLESIYSKFFTP